MQAQPNNFIGFLVSLRAYKYIKLVYSDSKKSSILDSTASVALLLILSSVSQVVL